MSSIGGPNANSAFDLKIKSPKLPSGYGAFRDEITDQVTKYWLDMETDGGGWVVVAEQNLYQHGYPNITGDLPTGTAETVNTCRITNWPRFNEYAVRNIVYLNGTNSDASLSQGFWKFNTGSFGLVEVDMMSFLLNKSDYQDGRASDEYVKFNGVPWADARIDHANHRGYRWFNTSTVTYNWWGQSDVWGHLVNTNLFRIASTVTGYARTANCGTGWANNSCRLSLNAWVNREIINHKCIFMVRNNPNI